MAVRVAAALTLALLVAGCRPDSAHTLPASVPTTTIAASAKEPAASAASVPSGDAAPSDDAAAGDEPAPECDPAAADDPDADAEADSQCDPAASAQPTPAVSIEKPPSWHQMTAADYGAAFDASSRLRKDARDAMDRETPVFMISKFTEPYPDVNPAVIIRQRRLDGRDVKGELEQALSAMRTQRPEAEIVTAPTEVELAGTRVAYAKLHYMIGDTTGTQFPFAIEIWFVPAGDWYLAIEASTRPDEKTGTRAEIAAILATLKIEQ